VPPTQEVRKRRPQLSPALHVVGKRPRRRWKLVASTGGRLIFLRDRIRGQSFLADTGATYSVPPHRSNAPPSGPNLVAADGRPIKSWGVQPIKLQFGDYFFAVKFLLADVAKPILGVDFFRENNLLVDPSSYRVLFANSLEPVDVVQNHKPPTSPFVAVLTSSPPWVRTLLASHPTVVAPAMSCHPHPLHGVEHVIETTGHPVFASARRLDPAKYAIAEKEFLELHGSSRCGTPVGLALGISTSYGSKTEWIMAAVRRLLATQSANCAGPVPAAQHSRF
jgi:hypothetical protein